MLHKDHNHSSTNGTTRPESNETRAPTRTTSTFTTSSLDASTNGDRSIPTEIPAAAGLWGSYDGDSTNAYSVNSSIAEGGFGTVVGEDGSHRPNIPVPSRALGGGRVTGYGVEEIIQITLLPEKEGMFMFQHHNYEVVSPRRGSKVIRRYSDFVWLLDCLHKRYPFRQLPLLPPKRVGGTSSPSEM